MPRSRATPSISAAPGSRLPKAFDPVLASPATTGLFLDFDGTLSSFVDDPAAARPHEGAVEDLVALAPVLGRVAIMSGRPLAFLEAVFPPIIDLSGLYGLEIRVGGVRTDHDQAGAWREVIDDIASMARARGPEGMRVEPKGVSLTLHYREHPEVEGEVRTWAATLASRSGLVVRPARMSVELHPPIAADKGTAIAQLSDDLDTVVYAGDDVGDLPAFAALDGVQAAGGTAIRIAVRNAEPAEALVAAADVVAEGPADVAALLRTLRRRLT